MCAKPFPAVLIVSKLFEKTVGDPDPPSTSEDIDCFSLPYMVLYMDVSIQTVHLSVSFHTV